MSWIFGTIDEYHELLQDLTSQKIREVPVETHSHKHQNSRWEWGTTMNYCELAEIDKKNDG